MKSLKLLTILMSTTIALGACSSHDDVALGSRDDIIIMKNGVPVSGSNVDVAMSAPSVVDANMVKPVIEVAKADVAKEAVKEKVTEVAETKVKEEITKVVVKETVAPVKEDVVAQVKAVAEKATKEIPMKEAKSVNTTLIQDKIEGVVEVVEEKVSTPMATTAMKTENVPVAEEAVVEEITAPAEPEKVAGGCYKKVLIPTVLDENKKMIQTPEVKDRRVVCQTKMTSGLVAIVQKALINRGHNLGNADGKLGNKTHDAIEAYQRKNGLGIGGFTYETLEHLGIRSK